MGFARLGRTAAFAAFAALSLTPAAAQTQPVPQGTTGATNAPVSCPMHSHGMQGGMMSPGMMHGQGPGAMGENWKQMSEQMQAMRQQMQAMHEEMMKLRQEMHRQR